VKGRTVWIPAFAGMTFGLVFSFVQPSFAEEPSVAIKTQVAPKEIYIGDRVTMDLSVDYAGAELVPPDFSAGAGEFEVLAVAQAPGKAAGGKTSVSFRLQLTTFSTGTITLAGLPITFKKPDGTFIEARTNAIPIKVKSLLEEQGDQGGLRPLKGLYNFRSWWWVWVLTGVAAAALLYWLWTLRKRKDAASAERAVPLLSPEDEAAAALTELEIEPVNEETIRDYYFRLSNILRRYIERRHDIPALEMTTSELLSGFRKLNLPVSATLICREFQDNADLVKFAKLMPSPEEVPADVARVRAFIDLTTPNPVPEDVKTPPAEVSM